MNAYCGIDWAESHHDIAVVDDAGNLLASRRIGDDLTGLHKLLDVLAEHGDTVTDPIPIAIETPRGLLVASLLGTGHEVYAINPMAAARYRDRHTVSRKKSDAQDASVLANILRTDRHEHRPLPNDSELARAIAVLARAQQDAVWNQLDQTNKVRAVLREYYPAALLAFPETKALNSATARILLRAAPTPAKAASLTPRRIEQLLRKAGRTRNLDAEVRRLHRRLHSNEMRMPRAVEGAYGTQLTAMLSQLDAASSAVDQLTQESEDLFATHPDAAIITSMPGLAKTTGARVLARDRRRPLAFRHRRILEGLCRCRARHPGQRPKPHRHCPTRQEQPAGRRRLCMGLFRLDRIARGPGHYDRRKAAGDRHSAAQRNLFNRLLSCLHHCLQHRVTYDETTAFGQHELASAA